MAFLFRSSSKANDNGSSTSPSAAVKEASTTHTVPTTNTSRMDSRAFSQHNDSLTSTATNANTNTAAIGSNPQSNAAEAESNSPPQPSSLYESLFSSRSLKQSTLFFAGAGFLATSLALTRRHIARRKFYLSSSTAASTTVPALRSTPRSTDLTSSSSSNVSTARSPTLKTNPKHNTSINHDFTPSTSPPPGGAVSGPVEAIEALSLATLNVAAVMIALVGGLAWAFDVSDLDDLRRLVRGGLGVDGSGRDEKEVEEEWEEWVAEKLSRKQAKMRRGGGSGISGREEEDDEAMDDRNGRGGSIARRVVVNERGRERGLD